MEASAAALDGIASVAVIRMAVTFQDSPEESGIVTQKRRDVIRPIGLRRVGPGDRGAGKYVYECGNDNTDDDPLLRKVSH
jgi:hypothetical protein